LKREAACIYRLAKAIHVAGLVLWLGPSSGGYYLIVTSEMEGKVAMALWLREQYINLIHLEAIGLLLLLASGVAMVATAQRALIRERWFRIKVTIVAVIFIPLEVIQLYLYHWYVTVALASEVGIEESIRLFDRFSLIALLLFIPALPSVLYLAIFKPGASLVCKTPSARP